MGQSKYLIEGPVGAGFIAGEIAAHSHKTQIGAHSVFLGQVRADSTGDTAVIAIDYSAYPEMVDSAIGEIRDYLFGRYDDLECLHIRHSTGIVKAGEVSLFVMASAGHRSQAFLAVSECVELIKEKLPVWKKELLADGSSRWID